MLLVKDLMTDPLVALTVGDTLADAEATMRSMSVRHLPVTDGSEHLVGLVSNRTLLAAWIGHGNPMGERHADVARDVPVEMIMLKELVTIGPDAPAAEAARLLEEKRIGCLPVIAPDGRMIGILTEADFLHYARIGLERAQ